MARTYNQFCALARALDVLGERWTLLIVRELLLGPRRFGDLLSGLPGIAPNLLSDRLRALAAEGVVQRTTLPPPAGSRVYELTERGRRLRPAVLALARWGMDPIAPPREGEERRPGWYAVALEAAFRPQAAHGVNETYGFWIDGTPFHLTVRDGQATASNGPATDPVCTLRCGVNDLLEIAVGARAATDQELHGSRGALERFLRAFPLPRPEAA